MPTARPALDRAAARRIAIDRGFTPPSDAPSGCVGLEHEWLTVRADEPDRPAPLPDVEAALAAVTLPFRSRLTLEPGGQVELSTRPLPGLGACTALSADAAAVAAALADHGVGLCALGLEPGARRPRVLRSPRYDAMEAHYDARNPSGRTMMRSTAALQVNVGLGDTPRTRWEAAHAVGPVLAAAFANSPFGDARPSGWRSTRLAVWSGIDGSRGPAVTTAADCDDAWADYVLGAPVMLVRASATEHAPVLDRFTFEQWITDGHELGYPTSDDLTYHATTLFPPVRPRGWLELRMIDALPDPWWRVAAAVSTALVDAWPTDRHLAAATAPVRDRWDTAAREGLSEPGLAAAARACFELARERVVDLAADCDTIAAVDEYTERYVARGRCPADDLLDGWRSRGALVPTLEYSPGGNWGRGNGTHEHRAGPVPAGIAGS